MKNIIVLYSARIIGIASRSLLSIAAGAILLPSELEKYNYIYALYQVLAYVISFEFYQVVHRSYLKDCAKKLKIHAHMFLYAINLVLIFIVAFCKLFGVVNEEFFCAVIAAFSYNIFIELYRYSGVLKKPTAGEIGYAVRGVLCLIPVLYLVHNNQASATEIILFCIVIDGAIGLALGVVFHETFCISVTNKRYLIAVARKFKALISQNLNTLMLMASTAVLSRFLLNFDKILGYMSETAGLSAKYYFSSMLALSYFGMVESVANNKYAPLLLSREISSGGFFRKQFNLILIFFPIAIIASQLADSILSIERFQSDIFLFFLLASALNMISNAASVVIYSRKKDAFNFFSVLITFALCGVCLGYLILYGSWGGEMLDLKMCIAYIAAMLLLLLIRLSFLMKVRLS